jgi:hypothetical protein
MPMHTINYSCGHGNYETQLTGNRSKRESYIILAESNKLCISCKTDSIKKNEENKPQIAKVYIAESKKSDEYFFQIIIKLEGKIEANKEILIGDNFSYSKDSRDNLFFGTFIFLTEQDILSNLSLSEKVKKRLEKTKELGYRIQVEFSEIDLQRIRQNLKTQKTIDEIESVFLVSNPEPKKPECWPAKYWNGKIYGTEKYGFRIYIDGSEKKLSKEEYLSIEKYNKDTTDWDKNFYEFKKQNLEKNTIKKSQSNQDLETEKLGFLGLGELTGTEKQINFSIKIRKDFLSEIEKSNNIEFVDCLSDGLPNDSQFWLDSLSLTTEEIVYKLKGKVWRQQN